MSIESYSRRFSLAGEWAFATGREGDGDRGPLAADLFDRRIRVPFAPQWPRSGLRLGRADVAWYARSVEVPDGRGALELRFGAVDYRARVWVDGALVAEHEGGHTPFAVDITAAAARGRADVVVRAEDPLDDLEVPRGKQSWSERPEGIFYTATTGIWQGVDVVRRPERALSGVRVVADPASGSLDVEATGPGTIEAVVRLDGRELARGAAGRLEPAEVRLWSPESPALYEVEVSLLDGAGERLDRAVRRAGMRTIECREGRFLLNGEPYVQRLVLDQGYWPESGLTAPSAGALRRDIELAKALGFNGARKHQKLEDPRWLDLADELGFLAWVEMPSFHRWSPAAGARLAAEWASAVRRDRDHPSVVAWTPANESFGLRELDAAERARYLLSLYELTRSLDPTRPVSSNDGWEHALTDLCTLHDYAAPAELARRYSTLASALGGGRPEPAYLPGYGYRGEPVMVSEFGGLTLAGSGGWGWNEVADATELVRRYREMVAALMSRGPVEGFCYTQLTDVEQERNGLLTAARSPKADATAIAAATRMLKAR